MYKNSKKIATFLILVFSFALVASVDAQKSKRSKTKPIAVKEVSKPKISYTVSMAEPWTHLLEVQMIIDWADLPEKAEVKLPVWTPGSYLVREYSRHVQDFAVVNNSGTPLNWEKTSKNTWQVDTLGAKYLRIGYRVYSNELTVRTNELNDEHAFFTPAALLMYPKDQLGAGSTVTIKPFGDWKVATGLPPVSGEKNTFTAENYDILFDSPFEVSDFHDIYFDVLGKRHRFVITGTGNYDLKRIAADTSKIVEQAAKIFGGLPYKDYTFILNLRGGGGLEHLNSTALQWNRFGFEPEANYVRFLGLIAHEYFHLFNVKRIRPVPLGPFDYENENYTKLLWVAEGLTSYYEGLLLLRAGLVNDKFVLGNEAGVIGSLYNRPGRFQTSLEEASFDAWIKYYRQDENSVNNQISYYDKGDLVNFLLDIEIRSSSNGTRSMDDVLRHLYKEFYEKNKDYSPADFQAACELMAGTSLDSFFRKYVRGREEIEYNPILNKIGLELVARIPESDKGYFGAVMSGTDTSTVRTVQAGSPAYNAGINSGDEIIAVDGIQASNAFLKSYIEARNAGDKIKLTLFRNGSIREFDVALGKSPASGYQIVRKDDATPEQQALFEAMLGDATND
ncbi:MAG: M61 family metallopeptidase [Pyrinomonadaceae bacterium]